MGGQYNSDLMLNLLDCGARWYDPAVGRFTGVDEMSDSPKLSPYLYIIMLQITPF